MRRRRKSALRRQTRRDPIGRLIRLAFIAVALIALPVTLLDQAPKLGLTQALAALGGGQRPLRAVEFLGLERVPAAELVARAGLNDAPPAAALDTDAVAAAIAGHPRVARARARRVALDRLLVAVDERRPLARLERGGNGVDAAGAEFALAPDEREALPLLAGDVASALPLLAAAQAAGLALERIDARGRNDVRFRVRGQAFEVRCTSDPAAALAALAHLADAGIVEGYGAGELDLRFRGQAVLRGFASAPKGRAQRALGASEVGPAPKGRAQRAQRTPVGNEVGRARPSARVYRNETTEGGTKGWRDMTT